MNNLDLQKYEKMIAAAKKEIAQEKKNLKPLGDAYVQATAELRRLLAERQAAAEAIVSFERDVNSSVSTDEYNEHSANMRRFDALINRARAEEKRARVAHEMAAIKASMEQRKMLAAWKSEFQRDVSAIREELESLM